MRKHWPWFMLATLLLALLAYVAAGPYLAVRGIRGAVERNDAVALARHVDFPALRSSVKAQLGDRLVRSVGLQTQSGLLGAVGLRLAGGLVDGAVEVLVTPTGLAALMEGRKVWSLLGEGLGLPEWADRSATDPRVPRPVEDAAAGASATTAAEPSPGRESPFKDARYRYESASRFTATVPYDGGGEVVFVFSRKLLRWRLSDIRLPQ